MKGFTLVETLVAITIVLLAVMGPFQLVKSSLLASYTARDQMIATALAEEGFEYVRGIRDNNYLFALANPGASLDWLHGLKVTPDCVNNNCALGANDAVPLAICGSSCPVLRLHPVTGFYTKDNIRDSTATRFTRSIRLEPVDGSTTKAVKVTVTVSFVSNHTPFNVTVVDYLYNWL